MSEPSLNQGQLDALKEIGTIGSGHAALALNQLIGKRVNIAVVKVRVVSSGELSGIVGGVDTLGAAIYLQLLGDLTGSIILFFKRPDALRLVDTLLNKEKGKTIMLSEMGISALKEAGNILTGSYLSAMSRMVSMTLALSIPKFTFDLIGFVMEGIFDEVMQGRDSKQLSVVTEFIDSTNQIKGYFILLPHKETLEKVLKALKV